MKKIQGEKKMAKVMKEFKVGKLHSGSKKGPKVMSKKQAVAIALSEAGKSKKSSKRGKTFNAGAFEKTRRKVFNLPKDY